MEWPGDPGKGNEYVFYLTTYHKNGRLIFGQNRRRNRVASFMPTLRLPVFAIGYTNVNACLGSHRDLSKIGTLPKTAKFGKLERTSALTFF